MTAGLEDFTLPVSLLAQALSEVVVTTTKGVNYMTSFSDSGTDQLFNLLDVTGLGELTGLLLAVTYTATYLSIGTSFAFTIDGQSAFSSPFAFYQANPVGFGNPFPGSVVRDDSTNKIIVIHIGPGLTFSTALRLDVINPFGVDLSVFAQIAYTLV